MISDCPFCFNPGRALAFGPPGDMSIDHRGGGRGFYSKDPNGHLQEVLTV